MAKNTAAYNRKYYASRDKVKKIAYGKARRQQLRRQLDELKATKSCPCGENDVRTLEFHHIGDKDYNVSEMISAGFGWDRIKEEVDKCIVLCANCHRKETFRDVGEGPPRHAWNVDNSLVRIQPSRLIEELLLN